MSKRMKRHAGDRGMALIEAVATITLVGLAVVMSVGVLLRWHAHAEGIDEVARAEQALATEMETQLSLTAIERRTGRWRTPLGELELTEARGEVTLGEAPLPGAQLVTLRIDWGEGRSVERQILLGVGS